MDGIILATVASGVGDDTSDGKHDTLAGELSKFVRIHLLALNVTLLHCRSSAAEAHCTLHGRAARGACALSQPQLSLRSASAPAAVAGMTLVPPHAGS
jgi:hypothetical protein